MKTASCAMLMTVALLSSPQGMAQDAQYQSILWDDLVPMQNTLVDPFTLISPREREDLSYVLRTKQELQAGLIGPDAPEVTTSQRMVERLSQTGFDLAGFERKLFQFNSAISAQGQSLAHTLEGRTVRMPGYALPLDLSAEGVSEFLLVPYVGACIHVPPPPMNQMVLVSASQSFRMRGLYDPVWITGTLKIEPTTQDLFLTDGEAQVAVGYHLIATKIEPYE